jgi:hypothetical protein
MSFTLAVNWKISRFEVLGTLELQSNRAAALILPLICVYNPAHQRAHVRHCTEMFTESRNFQRQVLDNEESNNSLRNLPFSLLACLSLLSRSSPALSPARSPKQTQAKAQPQIPTPMRKSSTTQASLCRKRER